MKYDSPSKALGDMRAKIAAPPDQRLARPRGLKMMKSVSMDSVSISGCNSRRDSLILEEDNAFDSITLAQSPASPPPAAPPAAAPTLSDFAGFIFESATSQTIPLSEAKEEVFRRMERTNSASMSAGEQERIARFGLRDISKQITDNRALGTGALRSHFMPAIVYYNHRFDFYELQSAKIQSNVARLAHFHDYLHRMASPGAHVSIKAFFERFIIQTSISSEPFDTKDSILHRRMLKIGKLPKTGPSDTMSVFLSPAHRTGQILERFMQQIENIGYSDLEVIVNALIGASKDKHFFNRKNVIDLLFDRAWTVRRFPFTPPFTSFEIQPVGDLVPRVFAPPFLEDSWSLMSFDQLSHLDWPLQPAVSRVWPMTIARNPFDIAEQFYEMIEEIGRCVQRILTRNNEGSNFLDLDFDQIFVLMIVTVLASGVTSLPSSMLYSFSFRDHANGDPHLEYAMSHMEGLCTHLTSVDYDSLRLRSRQALADSHDAPSS
jgi:hypothetical protein